MIWKYLNVGTTNSKEIFVNFMLVELYTFLWREEFTV
jgi:hypothetical protein